VCMCDFVIVCVRVCVCACVHVCTSGSVVRTAALFARTCTKKKLDKSIVFFRPQQQSITSGVGFQGSFRVFSSNIYLSFGRPLKECTEYSEPCTAVQHARWNFLRLVRERCSPWCILCDVYLFPGARHPNTVARLVCLLSRSCSRYFWPLPTPPLALARALVPTLARCSLRFLRSVGTCPLALDRGDGRVKTKDVELCVISAPFCARYQWYNQVNLTYHRDSATTKRNS
jgi:hypothetical protein